MLAARRSVWTKRPTGCSRKVRRGLLICRDAKPLRTGLDQFDCGDEFGLIRAAVGAYSENGPDGAAINPRRVRLIARRRQGLDASHPIRAQGPANRARVHRGSFWRHSTNERWQDEDCGRLTDLKWPKSYFRCKICRPGRWPKSASSPAVQTSATSQ